MATKRGALVSICHGAGPLPALKDPHHSALIRELSQNVRQILGLDSEQPPRAIAVFTAHWQTQHPTISTSKNSHLYYDYYGFPEEGYRITHDGKGSPEVAQRVFELLQDAGVNAQLDDQRGWDHGTFVPMKLIDPGASIPIVQISVLRSQDATELLQMGKNVRRLLVGQTLAEYNKRHLGRALAPLRGENVAMLGSGSPSFHDVRRWMSWSLVGDREFAQREAVWHEALEEALKQCEFERSMGKLERWREFPHSYEMHPKGAAEHFSPLLICAGAAEGRSVNLSKVEIMGAIEAFFWWD